MNIINVIILAVSSNLDDLGVGFSLGLKEKLNNRFIMIIALISAITMLVGLLLGQQVAEFISPQTASYISAAVFILLGIWFGVQGFKKEDNEAEENKENIERWTIKSAILLGLALGIDSITLGVSAGLVDYPILITTFFAGLTSFLFIWLGSNFSSKLAIDIVKEKADYISAGLLITLGVIQIFT